MTDQELLEYAAKAVGVEIHNTEFFSGPHLKGTTRTWNPLVSDADAFRLGVSLRLPVEYLPNEPPFEPGRVAIGGGYNVVEDVVLDDWNTAAKRAIVRAAAEIGRSMDD